MDVIEELKFLKIQKKKILGGALGRGGGVGLGGGGSGWM